MRTMVIPLEVARAGTTFVMKSAGLNRYQFISYLVYQPIAVVLTSHDILVLLTFSRMHVSRLGSYCYKNKCISEFVQILRSHFITWL